MKTERTYVAIDLKSFYASVINDNATSRAVIEKMPVTLPMLDLYGDEMCYRFKDALPTDNVQYYLHEKGEIFYWPPSHSLVIRYIETDEWLDIQHIGKVDGDVSVLNGIGDIDMKWELVEDASGVNNVNADAKESGDKVYALNGQQVSRDISQLPHGVYIKSKKKIIK